jgi:uroporphyrinogen-III synthase
MVYVAFAARLKRRARTFDACRALASRRSARPLRANWKCGGYAAAEPRPRRVLFPCGTLASEALPRAVTSQGIEIESVRVYATRRLSIDDRTRQLIEQGVDAVVLASPSAATAFGESAVQIGDAAVVCIGRATADACAPFNWPRVQVAASHSDAGVIESLVDALHA